MSKVIRLTENDLVRLVKKIVKEQQRAMGWNEQGEGGGGNIKRATGLVDPQPKRAMGLLDEPPAGVVRCSKLGVNSSGFCHEKTKKPVEVCAKLGVKMKGYCFVDSKRNVEELMGGGY